VLTTKKNQDKFQKNKQNQSIVRTTRILVDHRRSLKQLQTNRHRDVSSTSTSSNQWEHIDRNAEEYGTESRMVWWWPNKIQRLVERNAIVPQE